MWMRRGIIHLSFHVIIPHHLSFPFLESFFSSSKLCLLCLPQDILDTLSLGVDAVIKLPSSCQITVT